MKKLLILLILSIFLLSGCGIYNLNNFVVPDDTEFLKVIQELDTPEKICQYMVNNFTYQKHSFYAPSPYQLWLTKNGDCNDFATFAQFVANFHDYETYQIKIFYKNTTYKHMLAVYKENKYSFSDNWLYFPPTYNNFLEIVEYDCYLRDKTWTKYIVYDYWNNLIEQRTNN